MADKLEVEIGAEIKEFQSKLAKALKGFDELKAKEKELTKSFKEGKISQEKYYDALAKNSTDLTKAGSIVNKYKKSIQGVDKPLDKFSKGAISGSAAMTSFSRTIQDAPFGIMGVSNNITNLTEQFGYLKSRTGSTGGALKAMLNDLKGFGGITLGISLVTSLLLVFGDKIFQTKDKVKALRKEQEDLTKSLDDYAFGLEAVNKANLKGAQSGQKEIVTLRLLKSQIDNTTLSVDDRKKAINELREKYPEYLKNMSDEKILNGGLETTYKSLTKSIIQRAKATASMNAIVKNSETLLVVESQLLAKQNEIANQKIALDKKDTAENRRRKSAGLAAEMEKLNKLRQEENKLIGQKQNLELLNIDLEANVTAQGGIATSLIPDGTPDEIRKRVEALGSDLKNSLVSVQGVINEQPLQIISDKTLTDFDIKAMTLKAKLLEFNSGVQSLIQTSLASTFTGLGQSLGEALASGGNAIQAIGSSILGGISNFLGQLGKMMVEYGTMAVLKGKLDLAIAAGGPIAIGAGLAAIAVGTALSALSGAIGSFASSGGTSSSSAGEGTSYSSGSSSYSSGSSSSGGGTYVFEISGRNLVGVLKNELNRNKNLGGSLGI